MFGSSVGAIETRPQHFQFYVVNLLKREHKKWPFQSNFAKYGSIWKISNLGSPIHQIKCLKAKNWSIIVIGAFLEIAILAIFGQFRLSPNRLICQKLNVFLFLDFKFNGWESLVLNFSNLDFMCQKNLKFSFFEAFYLVTLLHKIKNAGDEFLWHLQRIHLESSHAYLIPCKDHHWYLKVV